MEEKEKQLSEFERIMNDAKASKHTDAILLLIEKKPQIRDAINWALNKNKDEKMTKQVKEADELVKKVVAIACEYVFSSCVNVLVSDKK